jgi:uncharacterized protein YegL
VSIDSLREELAQLEHEVQAAFAETGPGVKERAKTVATEIVAAEYIATKETMSGVGGIMETLSEIQAIQNEQFKNFFTDHRATLKALTQVRSPVDLAQLGFEHWSRRAGHVAEGITRTVDLIAKERKEMSESMAGMWKPFVQLVRGDWTRR